MTEHTLKVQAPYFDALLDGSKTFEVRRNDRAYQRGDRIHLVEWVVSDRLKVLGLPNEWPTGRGVWREVTFVYSGDPRWGGIEPGHVVLGLAETVPPTPE